MIIRLFLIVLLSSGNVFADEAEKGRNAGLEAGNKMRLELDSTDEINKKVVQPLTSEATPMRTFGSENEQQAFNAQLQDACRRIGKRVECPGRLVHADVRRLCGPDHGHQ